jgi:O-antigen/teichoic acid export membrane protein
MSYLTLAGGIGVGAISEAAMHRLAHSYAYKPRAYERLVKTLVLVALALFAAGVIVAYFFGGPILTLVYGASYAGETDAFLWLMVAGGVMYVVQSLGSSVTAARYFRVQVLMSVAGVTVNILLCAYLVPMAGLIGAAWASCGSHVTLLLIVLAITIRAFREGRSRAQLVGS